jgi:hypothetical protein
VNIYFVIHYGFGMRHIILKALKRFRPLCSTGNSTHIWVLYAPFHKPFMNIYAFVQSLYKVHGKLNFTFTSCEIKRSISLTSGNFQSTFLQHPNYKCMYVYAISYLSEGSLMKRKDKFERTILTHVA